LKRRRHVKTLSLVMVLFLMIIFNVWMFVDTEKRLSDCYFEVNNLQTKLDRYEELNDIVPALYQTLPPLALAELKTANEMISQKRHRGYEAVEQALIIRGVCTY